MVDLLSDEQIENILASAVDTETEIRAPDMPIPPPDDKPMGIDEKLN